MTTPINPPIDSFEMLVTEAFFGLAVMSLVTILNICSFALIMQKYRNGLINGMPHGKYYELFRLVLFIKLIVISVLLTLAIWVVALTGFNFVSDWVTALLFTAGFFTTVGNFTVNLPYGWRLIPSMIAFSGLFSFAWATAASLGMLNHFFQYVDKQK